MTRITSWSADEDATATNLWETGVMAIDVCETLNQLYRTGRTKGAVRARMHALGVAWASRRIGCADPVVDRIRRSQATRAEMRAAEMRAPWHPLHDNARLLAFLNIHPAPEPTP